MLKSTTQNHIFHSTVFPTEIQQKSFGDEYKSHCASLFLPELTLKYQFSSCQIISHLPTRNSVFKAFVANQLSGIAFNDLDGLSQTNDCSICKSGVRLNGMCLGETCSGSHYEKRTWAPNKNLSSSFDDFMATPPLSLYHKESKFYPFLTLICSMVYLQCPQRQMSSTTNVLNVKCPQRQMSLCQPRYNYKVILPHSTLYIAMEYLQTTFYVLALYRT